MRTIEELELRAALQIALLGLISPDIRSISFDFEHALSLLKFCVHFAGPPHEMALENMSSVLTEVEAGLSFRLNKIEEKYLVTSPPTRPNYLSKVVYARCESPDFLPPA
jgi:hypothetical protein